MERHSRLGVPERIKKGRHCEVGAARRGNPVTFLASFRGLYSYLRDSHASVRTGSE